MRIGNLRSFYHLLHRGIFHAESNVIEESIIKQNSFLIYVTNQSTQIGNTHIADTCPVDSNVAFLYIMVARQQIHQGRLTGTRLSHQRNRLSFGNRQIYMFQHFTLTIVTKRNILKFNFVIQPLQRFRIRNFLNIILRFDKLVHTFHRSQSLRDIISCFRKILQRIDYAIKYHHIEDRCRSIYRCILS